MSDTSGLPDAEAQGVPVEDDPERFEQGSSGSGADRDSEGAEPPPAAFDPAQHPSNPDLVENDEPPDE